MMLAAVCAPLRAILQNVATLGPKLRTTPWSPSEVESADDEVSHLLIWFLKSVLRIDNNYSPWAQAFCS